jgi:hypothetical protein
MRGQGRQGGAYDNAGRLILACGLMKRLSSFRASRSCLFAAGRLLASFVLGHSGRYDVLFSHEIRLLFLLKRQGKKVDQLFLASAFARAMSVP